MSERLPPSAASDYRHFVPIGTRWTDNDVYGHVNNAIYYEYFDTAVNHYLIHEGGLDIVAGGVIGLVVESRCRYHAPSAYPEVLRAGIRVDKLGERSVTYGVGVFRDATTIADGYFVHVFVDRETRRPTHIPAQLKVALERLR